MIPSLFQKEIYHKFRTTKSNIVINAGAGSGKTTTLLELLKIARGRVYFLAFNKSIVEELERRVNKPFVNISTLHSIGCKALYGKYKNLKVYKSKTYKFINIANKEFKWDIPFKKKDAYFYIVYKLVDIYRLTLCKDVEDLKISAGNIGIEFKDVHLQYTFNVLSLLEQYNKNPQEIDFTDMIYLPAIDDSIQLPTPDVLFIDECQDLNKAQHTLIDKMRRRGRFVAVGDPKQTIYGFAGTDSKSFYNFIKKENTIELPLSICYRCSLRVLDHANKIYNVLLPFENAKEGEVRLGEFEEAEPGDMIICRNLKPLIEVYFELISVNKKAYIKGKDIGESLLKLIVGYKDLSIENLFEELMKELHEISINLLEKGIQVPVKHPTYINFLEKIASLQIISRFVNSTQELINKLNKIFLEDDKDGIILSTIHKAKGLEASRVFLLNKGLIPSKYAITTDQKLQERNLMYVALTRAKESLIYCFN